MVFRHFHSFQPTLMSSGFTRSLHASEIKLRQMRSASDSAARFVAVRISEELSTFVTRHTNSHGLHEDALCGFFHREHADNLPDHVFRVLVKHATDDLPHLPPQQLRGVLRHRQQLLQHLVPLVGGDRAQLRHRRRQVRRRLLQQAEPQRRQPDQRVVQEAVAHRQRQRVVPDRLLQVAGVPAVESGRRTHLAVCAA